MLLTAPFVQAASMLGVSHSQKGSCSICQLIQSWDAAPYPLSRTMSTAASTNNVHHCIPVTQQSQSPTVEQDLTHQFIFVDWLNVL